MTTLAEGVYQLGPIQSVTTAEVPRENRRSGFTVTELLVAISVVSVVAGLLLPAIQQSREAARRLHCQNNLRQFGQALHGFEAARYSFPAGHDGFQQLDHSWCTAILPYLDETDLYQRYDYSLAWNAGGNAQVALSSPSVFLCPTTYHDWSGAVDYGGLYGVGFDALLGTTGPTSLMPGFGIGYGWDQGILTGIRMPFSIGPERLFPIRIADIKDGTSHTFLVAEDAGRPAWQGGRWADGHNCFSYDGAPVGSVRANDIFSDHGAGVNMLMADGAVIFLSQNVNIQVVAALCTRARGDVVDDL